MKKLSCVSWLMALVLVMNLLVPVGTAYAEGEGGTDKTGTLTNVAAAVMQNGEEITGNTLPNADNLSIEVSFGVPAAGDYPEEDPIVSPIVKKGDTAVIVLGTGFSLSSINVNLPELTDEADTVIGHVTAFSTDPDTKAVTVAVVFDGEIMGDENISGIKAGFKANLQVSGDGSQEGSGSTAFTILNKTYTIVRPNVPTVYNVSKSGTVDVKNKCVNWTVVVTAKQGDAAVNADLTGYTFSDDLTGVGAYKDGTFMVGSSAETAAKPSEGLSYEGGKLTYAFPDGTASPQTIKFSTALTDEECYATSGWTKNNTAQLKKDDAVAAEKEGSASFTPKWIEKTVSGTNDAGGGTGSYNPAGRTITWTITANENGATLNNAVITEILKDGLTLDSATLKTMQSDGEWSSAASISSDPAPTTNGDNTTCTFPLGTISTQILLTIVTKVPDAAYVAEKTTYKNSASLSWDGGPAGGVGTGDISADIGFNAISKEGVLNPQTGVITWTVTVDTRGQKIPDLKVYDLIAYGEGSAELDGVAGIPSGVPAQFNQKYIDGSFGVTSQSAGSDLKITSTALQKGGKAAADLLEITGFAAAASNSAKFTFQTQVVNPDVFAGNSDKTVKNTAVLFSANAKLNEATGTVTYSSHMLAKEMLNRDSDPTTTAGANNKTTDITKGFDYVDKSAVFRLSVNAMGMDLSNMKNAAGEKLGTVTVTDTLPEGWVFDKIDGENFLIFEGNVGTDKSVTAVGDALTDTSFVTADFTGKTGDGKNTAIFTFTALDKPYVILIKARPSSDTVSGYFDSNASHTVTNNLDLKAAGWTTGTGTSQDVTIDSTILSKNLDSSKAQAQAYLTWTVEYKPYELDGKGTRIEDTLPLGIDLRTDSAGRLLMEDKDGGANIAINELTLLPDGSYADGAGVSPVQGTNVSYDGAKRVLTFNIPDPSKAYRFTYVTDITGNSGSITNQVKLYGPDSNEAGETDKNYSIVEQSGWATLQRGGSLVVTKTDGSDAPLTGAEFTLYASDGVTVIRRGTVAADGTLKMRAIPVGTYTLRETKLPDGYLSENLSDKPADHTVSVKMSGSAVITSIDGKTGADSNALTVKNYKTGTAGNLTISKTVAGNAGDLKKAFTFTLNLTGAPDTYRYIGVGVPDGTIKSGDTFALAHGQSITVVGLPKGAGYTVTEDADSADGYTVACAVTAQKTLGVGSAASGNTVTGTVAADDTQTAAFTNTRNVFLPGKGDLIISKTVTGKGADPSKKFSFTVMLTGAPDAYTYTGSSSGTLRGGDTVSLAGGESITITGLPEGAKYTVTEADYSGQGYTAEGSGTSGVITAGTAQLASYTNTWSGDTEKPGNPGKPGKPGDTSGSIGDGEVPHGSMEGGENGMPKTGDSRTGSLAGLGLLVSSCAFAALAAADFVLRGKYPGKRKRK